MKAKALLLLVSSIGAPALCAYGQVDCTTSTKLVCELPTSAAVLAASVVSQPNQSSQAQAAAIQSARVVSNAVNSSIGTQLTQLPIPSGSVGVVSLQQPGNPLGVPYENLGPILSDRPDTVGRHRLFAGFSYQHFNFNAIDGIGLKDLPAGFMFSQTVQVGNQPSDIQTIYSSEENNVKFHLDQYVGLVTWGLTRTTDVSVAVPFSRVSLNVVSSNFQAYLFDTNSQQYQNETLAAGTIPSSGSASGIGDVVVNVKQLLLGGEGRRPAVAVGADLRFPTGDSLNYLGSGAYGVNLHGLFEYRWKISPHFKVGYQWNSSSILVETATKNSNALPGGLQYAAGADYSIKRALTIAVDILGSQFVNSPSLSPTTLVAVAGTPALPSVLPTIESTSTTYTTANFSGGLKLHVAKHWTFYGNVLVPLKNVGLRSDPVPLAGIAFNK
jgi:Putative MetA-pathway of phenol degradation